MAITPVPGCCGASFIHYLDEYNPASLRNAVKGLNDKGLVIAISASHQRAESKMKAAGFVALKTVRNPNSGNTIKLWAAEPVAVRRADQRAAARKPKPAPAPKVRRKRAVR